MKKLTNHKGGKKNPPINLAFLKMKLNMIYNPSPILASLSTYSDSFKPLKDLGDGVSTLSSFISDPDIILFYSSAKLIKYQLQIDSMVQPYYFYGDCSSSISFIV
jgi:hypothetical protein